MPPSYQQVQSRVRRWLLFQVLAHVLLDFLASGRWLAILVGLRQDLLQIGLHVHDFILGFTEAPVVNVRSASLHLAKRLCEISIANKEVHHENSCGVWRHSSERTGQKTVASIGANLPVRGCSGDSVSHIHGGWHSVLADRFDFSHVFGWHLFHFWCPLVLSQLAAEPGVLAQVERRGKHDSSWIDHWSEIPGIWFVAEEEVELPVQDVIPR